MAFLSKRGRWLLNITGAALSMLGLILFARMVLEFRSWRIPDNEPTSWIFGLLVACLLQVAGNCILGLAWRRLLMSEGVCLGASKALSLYARSVPAKYIPGNVFQFVSRQFLGVAAGITGKTLAKTTLLELIGVSLAGGITSLLCIHLLWQFPGYLPAVLFSTALIVATVLLRKLLPFLCTVFLLHVLYVMTGALSFLVVLFSCRTHMSFNAGHMLELIGAHAGSWLAGLLTPGAPAGLGVRETALYSILRQTVASDHLLTAILLSRLAALAGDLLFFAPQLLSITRNADPVLEPVSTKPENDKR